MNTEKDLYQTMKEHYFVKYRSDVLTRNAGDGENLLLPFSGVGQLSTAKASVSFSGIRWRTPDYFLVSPAAWLMACCRASALVYPGITVTLSALAPADGRTTRAGVPLKPSCCASVFMPSRVP